MDYLTYYMMHVDPLKPGEVEILPLPEVESGPIDSNKRKGDMGTNSNVAKKARMALTKYDFELVSEYRKWVNQCRFDCQLCPNLQSKDSSALYKHLKDVHKCSGPAYREKFGQSMMSHEVTFTCKIKDCSEESLHHYRGISKHLQKYHEGLAPKDYFAQHVYEKSQVWPLTQFFVFPFCENSLICLEGKSMTPHRGNTVLSQQLPRLRLGPSKGFLS